MEEKFIIYDFGDEDDEAYRDDSEDDGMDIFEDEDEYVELSEWDKWMQE